MLDEQKLFLADGHPQGYKSLSQSFFEKLKWLTASEAVVYLRLPSVGALRNLVYRRKIPFAKCGRNLRFNRESLDQFLESSTVSRRIST